MLIFGGWQNSLSVICRNNEHGDGRKARAAATSASSRTAATTSRSRGAAARWTGAIDGRPFLCWTDPEPLAGAGHEYLAVNDWEADAHVRQPHDPTRPLIADHGRTSESPISISSSALAALAGRKSLLIYTHDNPDPDALAAALGLQRLAEHELGI